MSECNVNQLSSDAACFTCLDPKTRDGIQTELLCQILHAIGGGGGGTSDVTIVSSITLQVEATDFDIRDLDFLTDSVDVTGSTVIATGSLGRTWTLDFATDQVDASGSLVGAVQAGAWSVSVSNFPASFSVTQGTSPWVVSLASTTITGTVAVTQSGTWTNRVEGTTLDGAATPTRPVLVGGQDGTNLQSIRTDTLGNVAVFPKNIIFTLTDGLANNPSIIVDDVSNGIPNLCYSFVFNGTTWDRLRGDSVSGAKVSISGLTAASYGQVDVPVTQVAVPTLSGSKTTCIKALAANSQKVYVGKTGVSATTGFELGASDSVEVDTTDAVPWFMISGSGTQRICYIVVS